MRHSALAEVPRGEPSSNQPRRYHWPSHALISMSARSAAKGAALRADIEMSAWDGQWYRRGWFDDGSPLGTSANAECRIDSIAQSWAVLSGAGDPQRVRQAMDAVDAQLVH